MVPGLRTADLTSPLSSSGSSHQEPRPARGPMRADVSPAPGTGDKVSAFGSSHTPVASARVPVAAGGSSSRSTPSARSRLSMSFRKSVTGHVSVCLVNQGYLDSHPVEVQVGRVLVCKTCMIHTAVKHPPFFRPNDGGSRSTEPPCVRSRSLTIIQNLTNQPELAASLACLLASPSAGCADSLQAVVCGAWLCASVLVGDVSEMRGKAAVRRQDCQATSVRGDQCVHPSAGNALTLAPFPPWFTSASSARCNPGRRVGCHALRCDRTHERVLTG